MSNEYFPVTGHLENFNKEIEKLSNFSVRYFFFVLSSYANRHRIAVMIASKVLFSKERWPTKK